MPIVTHLTRSICPRCLRATAQARTRLARVRHRRTFASTSRSLQREDGSAKDGVKQGEEQSTLSRRLEQMSEEALETGGRSAQRVVEEAGFSEELQKRLGERIASANFRNEHARAIAEASLPSSADKHTRGIAAAEPWTGTESVEDASLRMLTDAYKPLRPPPRSSSSRGPPVRIDTGRPAKGTPSTGTRLANARDRSSAYASMKDSGMSEQEREQFIKEMKAKYQPEGRAMPTTLQGLTSLANERIEDAIARGQFKNLPRGKVIERDYNASSPFIDTTEYLLNKLVQRQDIKPPWIEKQQELASAVHKFRARLRNDWKRHAARLIASKGGTLAEQVKRAEEYAAAEAIENPPRTAQMVTAINADGTAHMSQISLSGDLNGSPASAAASPPETPTSDLPTSTPTPETAVRRHPFRDPTWEQTELAYHTLAIASLNNLTRSYNLIAPKIAQRPHYTLARELRAMYADVAPLLAQEIIDRASAPRRAKVTPLLGGAAHEAPVQGLLEGFGKTKVRVYEEDARKGYGFKELWRDIWKR